MTTTAPPVSTDTQAPIPTQTQQPTSTAQAALSEKETAVSELAVVTSRPATMVVTPSEGRETLALTVSMRPTARPDQQSETQPAPTHDDAAPARRGNAEVNAARGQQAGSEGGTVAQSSGAQQTSAQQVGQGEVNDYKSRVASRVIRVADRMRSRGSSGDVVVGMQIAGSGHLAAATVVQSSGNQAADTIALDAIRRAAPFDPTPGGQGITFRFAVRLVSD
ncbi:TonB family protein [Yoonia sp. GPGPB17]|uniref:cell envelope integrity protein TolA n=1 Tax=Yoonia sp. GPGPB17 TaxID=3026147 RepID=UPI0030C2E243